MAKMNWDRVRRENQMRGTSCPHYRVKPAGKSKTWGECVSCGRWIKLSGKKPLAQRRRPVAEVLEDDRARDHARQRIAAIARRPKVVHQLVRPEHDVTTDAWWTGCRCGWRDHARTEDLAIMLAVAHKRHVLDGRVTPIASSENRGRATQRARQTDEGRAG